MGFSSVEIEKLRIRTELHGLQDSSLEDLPPSSDCFDVTPNLTDEVAYDALEKAYNAAFLGTSARRGNDSIREILSQSDDAKKSKLIAELAASATELYRRIGESKIALQDDSRRFQLTRCEKSTKRCIYEDSVLDNRRLSRIALHVRHRADEMSSSRRQKRHTLHLLATECCDLLRLKSHAHQSKTQAGHNENDFVYQMLRVDTTEPNSTTMLPDKERRGNFELPGRQSLCHVLSAELEMLLSKPQDGCGSSHQNDSNLPPPSYQVMNDRRRSVQDIDQELSRLQTSLLKTKSDVISCNTQPSHHSLQKNPFQKGVALDVNLRLCGAQTRRGLKRMPGDSLVDRVLKLRCEGLNAVFIAESGFDSARKSYKKFYATLANYPKLLY
ncbi:hypothetical protein PINS_up017125 [Pythium insidiosum]|nr:hypothetical protein PINS_up017125 [Pythium insidiosum]